MKSSDVRITASSLSTLISEISTGNLSLTHKFQRKTEQWNLPQKQQFIESIFKNHYVGAPSMILIYEDKNEDKFVIDGVQRLSVLREFFEGKFKMQKDLSPITIKGKEYDLSRKSYLKLEDAVRNVFRDTQFSTVIIRNVEEDELGEIFYKQNNGTPLTVTQKNIVKLNEHTRERFDEVLKHPFWTKTALKKGDYKKDTNRNELIKCMYTIDSPSVDSIVSYKVKDLYKYIDKLQEEDRVDEVISKVVKCLDNLERVIKKPIPNLKKLSIAPVVGGAYDVGDNLSNLQRYANIVISFFEDDYYKSDYLLKYGSTSISTGYNVRERVRFFQQVAENATM